MSFATTEHELHRACEIIFGPELAVTREFLEYLQPAGVKSAYRKRAMETHPDRFASSALVLQQQDNELFHAVQRSYEHLLEFLKAREQGFRLPYRPAFRPTAWQHTRPPTAQTTPRPQAGRPSQHHNGFRAHASGTAKPNNGTAFRQQQQQTTAWSAEQLYRGPIPNRRLLLGHFLYYSGIASWRMVVQALIWQRAQRPRIGELGQRFGLLQEEEIRQILRSKALLEPFGVSAVAMGYLTETQLQVLIHHQKRLQKKFGAYFVENKILRPDQFAALLRQYHEHNTRLAADLGFRFRS
ncbi:MAG TPA: J domain-containing protein [Desulfurivibrionaceae bacterium]|nr:J domain-containing protein [Desulfurivibrionaceae bacterium]